MMRFLLYIKHHLGFIWKAVEMLNGFLFSLLWGRKLQAAADEVCRAYSNEQFSYMPATAGDLATLSDFFVRQPEESYRYFKPHAFDEKTLRSLYANPSFFQLLVKDQAGAIAGYFLIRFFVNRQAFVGYLVGKDYQGRGIAKTMCLITFKICWDHGFRTFATVSKENKRALAVYRHINDFKVIKELADDYLHIEYVKEGMEKRE